mgnify:CR=1 FL=1
MKYFYSFIILCCLVTNMLGQHTYGTSGLLYSPTAEMQKDKTVMIGGSMIDHNIYRDAYGMPMMSINLILITTI